MSTKLLENKTCPICHLKSNTTLTLPCGCKQICPDCMSHWISFKKPSIQCKIPCPVETCKKEFALEEIISILPESEKAKINEFINKISSSHLQKSSQKEESNALSEGFFKKLLDKLRNCKNEIFTFFWKFFKTKKCPGCKVPITIDENDGCENMECTQCRYQFCWCCLKDVCRNDYDQSGEITPMHSVYLAIIIALIGLVLGGGALWGLKIIGSWIVSLFA